MVDLRAKFLPRFRAIAAERMAKMRAAGAASAIAVDELHALAGEAAILGTLEVADLARAAESRCRASSWTPDEWDAALATLEDAIARA